jgi:hypothetical protein
MCTYLAEAQRLSHTGSWHWNVTSGEVFWSKEFFSLFGFDSEKDRASLQSYLERIRSEDRSKVENAQSAAMREKEISKASIGSFSQEVRSNTSTAWAVVQWANPVILSSPAQQ